MPKTWDARISDNTKNYFYGRFFSPSQNAFSAYIEIESSRNKVQLESDSLKTIQKTETRNINGTAVTFIEGKENYKNSQRSFKTAILPAENNNFISINSWNANSQTDTEVGNIISTLTSRTALINPDGTLNLRPVGANPGYIEPTLPAQFPTYGYVQLQVMGDPVEASITAQDLKYRNGFAKLYKFSAFKGQRISTNALELSGSGFIKSDLYDENGILLDIKDTRLEFVAKYTGTYHLVIYSQYQKTGNFRLKVFDRTQFSPLPYAKYADGRERLIDNAAGDIKSGAEEFSLIFQYVSPLTVVGENRIQYEHIGYEYGPSFGIVNTTLQIWGKQQSLAQHMGGTSLMESDSQNILPVETKQISTSRILITQKNSVPFPSNYHIYVANVEPHTHTDGKTYVPFVGVRVFSE